MPFLSFTNILTLFDHLRNGHTSGNLRNKQLLLHAQNERLGDKL